MSPPTRRARSTSWLAVNADDVAFVAELAAQRLYVLPGSTVSLPGWFRISLTGSDAMIEAATDLLGAARRAVGPAG